MAKTTKKDNEVKAPEKTSENDSALLDDMSVAAQSEESTEDHNSTNAAVEPNETPTKSKYGRARFGFWASLVIVIGALIFWYYLPSSSTDQTASAQQSVATVSSQSTLMPSIPPRDSVAAGSRSPSPSPSQSPSATILATELVRLQAEQEAQLLALAARTTDMEEAFDQLRGVSVSAKQIWLRAEIEYLLELANNQLSLAGDVDSALTALAAADQRLVTLSDPGFNGVRKAIANERTQLKSIARPDIQGMALTLAALAGQVTDMSVAARYPANYPKAQQSTDAGDSNGLSRAWGATKHALVNVVSIRKTTAVAQPLLAPEEEFFLRRNLELQLLSARAALLQQDPANFIASLDSSRAWLNSHFDTSDSLVSQAIATMQQFDNVVIAPALPDISDSLRKFRQVAARLETTMAP